MTTQEAPREGEGLRSNTEPKGDGSPTPAAEWSTAGLKTDHKLGITVVSWHSEPDLRLFLQSIEDSDPSCGWALNVMIMDARSGEGSSAVALADTDFLRSHTQVIVVDGNPGYAWACNDGAARSALDSDIDTYAFFNADTELRPGVLESCLDLLWSRDDYAVVGPRQIDRRGCITHAGIFGPHTAPTIRGWRQPDAAGYRDVRDDCYSVSGSIYIVKRPVWEKLRDCPVQRSLFPDSTGACPEVQLYYEDTWVSVHAISHGYKIVYQGEATAIHDWHGAIGQLPTEGSLFRDSKAVFIRACQAHGIEHD